MKAKAFFVSFIFLYGLICGVLVFEAGLINTGNPDKPLILLQNATETEAPAKAEKKEAPKEQTISSAPAEVMLGAQNSEARTVIIGAKDPNTENPERGFKLQLKLNTKGASIEKATFSYSSGEDGEHKGFSDRDANNPRPLVLLNPLKFADGSEVLSMSNDELVFVDRKRQLPLNKLQWQFEGTEEAANGCEKATFSATITNQISGDNVLKITKTFSIPPGSYLVDCDVNIVNLSPRAQNVRFNMTGPVGVTREDVRSDMRNVVSAYKNANGEIVSSKLDIRKLKKADSLDEIRIERENCRFLWAAVTNKYFAAIVVPLAEEGKKLCGWLGDKYGQYYNPDGDAEQTSGDETIGLDMKIAAATLAPAGAEGSGRDYNFHLYLGPKDKELFDSDDYYKNLGFFHTITFLGCCCPTSIIQPLAFFIMWLMNALFVYIPNYGVVIIILVFIVRTLLHPLTKAGQVRMNRFTKILNSPEVQEIKKKYGKSPMEMQKRINEFQKERGVSPADMMLGMLPMFIQMPLWIALWSSVNSSINLRGAGFLPFWITDLSVPDALISWRTITIPLLFFKAKLSSLNLLPILMGVAFYLQQKTMPQQAAATPEQQQQQKIMKWMMLLMFPLILYSAPSGVNLYIMASSFAGAIEQYYIRKHIREKEEQESRGLVEVTSKTGGKVKKKKPKPFIKF